MLHRVATSKAVLSTQILETFVLLFFFKAVMDFLEAYQGVISHRNLGNLRNGRAEKTSVSHQVERESQQL